MSSSSRERDDNNNNDNNQASNQQQQTTNQQQPPLPPTRFPRNRSSNLLHLGSGGRAGSHSANTLPTNASTRSLAEMSNRSMDSPRSITTAGPHEVIEFLRGQSVAPEDCDSYKKIFEEQLLRNFNDIKIFGEDRLASSGVKRGHARRIFAEIEKRDRDAAARQRQLTQSRRGGAAGMLRQSISTANLYGALYDMTPVATPVAGESHGLFPNIGSSQNLESLAAASIGGGGFLNNNNNNNQHQDPHNNNHNSSQDAAPMNVVVNNSAQAKADPFRTSAIVVPGDFVCNLCCELLYSARTVPCGHTFCALCLERWANSQQGNPTCPLCRANLIHKGRKEFELPAVNSVIESLCQRCFPGRYQRSAKSAEEQRRSDEEIRLAYALVRHPADGLLVKILLNSINISRPLELLFLRLPRREFLPPSFLPSANRIECGSISPTQVEGYGFNMTSASLHATIMTALQLEPGHWFLDAGAGTGIVAAWAATLVGPTGTSLALDHDTKAAQLMRRNRIIHDQLLYHPTMPLSGANFAGEMLVLADKYCLFPNLAAAPIAGRRTQFQNLLLNPSIYETGNGNNNNNSTLNRNTDNDEEAKKKRTFPIAIQILGIERSSAFLDRFAGGSKNNNNSSAASGTNGAAAASNGMSPQSQQSQPFGGGGCVVHATVTIGNSATSSRRQCRMVGTVRLVSKTDQFQVLSSSQHQHARNAVKTRITPSTHPRSASPEREQSGNSNEDLNYPRYLGRNSNNGNNNNNNHDDSEDEDQDTAVLADQIPPLLPTAAVRGIGNNRYVAAQVNNADSASLSDESVLCEVTDLPSADNNHNEDAEESSSSSTKDSMKINPDHHILFSLREVTVFGSDDTGSVFNFGDSQTVDHERLMRLTFCLTKPIGELLSDSDKQEEKEKNDRQNNNNNNNNNKPSPIDAFGIFVASLLRRSDVVATTKLQLLDGANVIRQLKRWIDGTWIPSEFKPNKYHCLQTNVYDFAQVLFGKNRELPQSIDIRHKVLDLIKPTISVSSNSSRSDTPAISALNQQQHDDETSASMMMMRADTAPPQRSNSNMNQEQDQANQHDNDSDDALLLHQDEAAATTSINNNNNQNQHLQKIFNSSHGFFDRVFLACEPQSEADLKRFQRLLKPGGRMVVPFDSELWLIKRPAANSSSNNTNNDDPFAETFPRESLYQVGFGTFISPEHDSQEEKESAEKKDEENNHDDGDGDQVEHMGTPRTAPIKLVTRKINEAIEEEKYHMRQLQQSYRLFSLSAIRNRSIKNSPLLSAASSPPSKIAPTATSNLLQRNDHDEDDVPNTHRGNNNINNNSATSPHHLKDEPIILRCCGNKLASSKWNETIDVSKIWGNAPFADGATVCINRPESFSYFPGSTYLKRARGSSYLAYNVDLCARMSYVECAHCNVVVGAEFCDEPLLTQPDGPWTGRVLLCSSMICKEKDIVANENGERFNSSNSDAIKCGECSTALALPTWRLRSELELRLRHGSRARSILATADFHGLLFTRTRQSAVETVDDFNNQNNNNNNNNSPKSNLKLTSDGNLEIADVVCSHCRAQVGFKITKCRTPFAKSRLAFTINRVALIPSKVKGVPSSALRQPQNLMERIYRAIAQSFGINPAEGAQFILRDGNGNSTIFDGGNLVAVREPGNNENNRNRNNTNNNNNINDLIMENSSGNDDDDDDQDEDDADRTSTTRNDPELDRARRLRNMLIDAADLPDAHEDEDEDDESNDHNDDEDIQQQQQIRRRPENPTPVDEDNANSNSNNNNNNDNANQPTEQQARSALAAQLNADFDLMLMTDENDPNRSDDDDDDDVINDP